MRLTRFWRRYRVRVVARLAVVALTTGGAGVLVGRGGAGAWAGAAVLAGVALWAAWGLVRAVERPARDLRRFLEGVRYDDVSVRFPRRGADPFLDGLAAAFEEVGAAFRRVRAEREEQAVYLEAVVRHVGVALVAFRADGAVTLFNLAARRTLGVARPRTLGGLARRAPEAAEALRALPAGERALVRMEHADGPRELVAYATRFTVGGEAHTLVSLQDIREELEARELEAWQELSRVLTHEIANSVAPIASLAGTARALVDAGAGRAADGGLADGRPADGRLADVREALGTIERRSRGLVSFVDAYRTLARLPRPRPRVVSAAELLGDVATLARASAPGVAVGVDVDPPGLELVADADLVEQALVNLALNAVEALGGRGEGRGGRGRPGGHVVLRARAGASGRGVVEVEDDGPGLLPEVRERAFVPFFSTKPGGSGVGLALAHRIARLHGGTLAVESEPDVRTVFTLRL